MAKQMGPAQNLLIGGTAAILSTTAVAPLNRVKILVQVHGELLKSGRLSEPYRGPIDCIKRLYKTEGIFPFWRGNLVNCIKYVPSQACNVAFRVALHNKFGASSKSDSYSVKLFKNICLSGLAGALSTAVVYPFDYCNTRLVSDIKSVHGKRQFSGMIDVFKKTIVSDGIVGLYRGFVISCVGIAVYRGCYFGLYDTLRPILLGNNANLFLSFGLGFTVSLSAGLIAYPFDTVRRRMLMRSGESVKYKGSFDCASQIIRKEGFTALMKGVSVTIFMAVSGAFLLPTFDILKSFFTQNSRK